MCRAENFTSGSRGALRKSQAREIPMRCDTLIVNGIVVTATDTYAADVAISDGKIVAIGEGHARENADRVIYAKGRYVMPGGIDVHTHLNMPFGGTNSADDFETGTRAAAFGVTRTLIGFSTHDKRQPQLPGSQTTS